MGAMTLDVDGWQKQGTTDTPEPIDRICFHVSEKLHLQLEAIEEELRNTDKSESFLETGPETLEVETTRECGQLSDCKIRVYLDDNNRAHFHLVGHRASDHSMIYSNSVMVDHLL